METAKDALSPLHPPAPTAPPVVDAAHDVEHDKRHAKFEQIKHMPEGAQYVALSNLIEEFIAAGHNPRDPSDLMFQILGITPEFLESLLFAMKAKVPVKDLAPDSAHHLTEDIDNAPVTDAAPAPAAADAPGKSE